SVQIVCTEEELDNRYIPELCDGQRCRAFHIDGKTALLFPLLDKARGLPVNSVCGPDFSKDIGNAVFFKAVSGNIYRGSLRSDFLAFFDIMVAGAFVSDRGGRNDHFVSGCRLIENAAASELYDSFRT